MVQTEDESIGDAEMEDEPEEAVVKSEADSPMPSGTFYLCPGPECHLMFSDFTELHMHVTKIHCGCENYQDVQCLLEGMMPYVKTPSSVMHECPYCKCMRPDDAIISHLSMCHKNEEGSADLMKKFLGDRSFPVEIPTLTSSMKKVIGELFSDVIFCICSSSVIDRFEEEK
jgi:hypothetical protein